MDMTYFQQTECTSVRWITRRIGFHTTPFKWTFFMLFLYELCLVNTPGMLICIFLITARPEMLFEMHKENSRVTTPNHFHGASILDNVLLFPLSTCSSVTPNQRWIFNGFHRKNQLNFISVFFFQQVMRVNSSYFPRRSILWTKKCQES